MNVGWLVGWLVDRAVVNDFNLLAKVTRNTQGAFMYSARKVMTAVTAAMSATTASMNTYSAFP